MTTHDDLRARAANGAALLDTVRPGWYQEIQLRALDIADGHRCVLGQLYGGYHRGMVAVFPRLDDIVSATEYNHAKARSSNEHGFSAYDIPDSADSGPWAELTAAWRDEITARKFADCTREISKDADKEVVMISA